MAPTSRTMARSSGAPTWSPSSPPTRPPLSRSSGLVEWIWVQWSLGKDMWASTSSSASSISSPSQHLGPAVGRDCDSDYHGNGHDRPGLAHLHVGRVDP